MEHSAERPNEESKGNARPEDSTPCVRVSHFVAIFGWAVALLLVLRFFEPIKVVVLGLLAAACLAAALRPLVRKSPGPRSLKAVLVGLLPPLLVAGLLILAAWQLTAPLKRQLDQWPEVEQQVNHLLGQWSRKFDLEQPLTVDDLAAQAGNMFTGSDAKQIVSKTTHVFSSLLIAAAFVFIGSIYMLIEHPQRLLAPVLQMLPERRRPQVQAAWDSLGPRLRWWLIGTLLGMTTIGVASWIGYSLVGLQFALPLALLAGIGEGVPTIGPLVTYLVALLFAAAQGTGQAIGVTVVYIVVQILESYVLLPLVMKKAVDIPPLVTLFTLVLWGSIFGPAGLLLAIPIDLVIWSFAEHLLTRPVLLSSEP